jgi:hypothetical protein
MAKEYNNDFEEILATTLAEAKKKRHAKKREEEEEEGEEEEEESSKKRRMEEAKREEEEEEEEEEESGKRKKKKQRMEEETLAASSLHPGARSVSDPKSKIGMMQSVMGQMNQMSKGDLTHWFNATMAQFGPGKDYGVGDNSVKNTATLDMKTGKGPKTKYAMPKLGIKEDVEEMFNGYDISEEFKEEASTLFEAAISARLIAETARIEEEYEEKLNEELATLKEEVSTKLDAYLDYVVESWMIENEVAIESTLRNELMEEFMEGLKDLFAEHYISVPQEKIDVVEALAEKVGALEGKLDEAITENSELKNFVTEEIRKNIFEEISSDLALTQQEKFGALVEGIEFDGDFETYSKKLKIVKENYFRVDSSYTTNFEEETFEGDLKAPVGNIDPSVSRYVNAIARSIKK